MKRKFFLKNLAMFIIPLLIPIFILGSFSFFITQKYVKNEINKNNMILLNQIAQNIEMMLDEFNALTISFNHDYSIVVKLRQILDRRNNTIDNIVAMDMFKSMLKTPVNSKPYIHSIYVYYQNSNHYFISTRDGLTSLDSSTDTSWYNSFIENKTDKNTWLDIRNIREYSFETEPFKVISIYNKLLSSSNKPTGVIVMNIYPEYVKDTLKGLITYPGQEILVMDENNQIIFNSTGSPSDLKHIKDLKEASNNNSSFFSTTISGKPYVISKFNSNRLGLKYISIIPQEAIYSVPKQLAKLTCFLLIVSFILGLAIAYYITQKNYNQILNIISIINSAETGNKLPPLPNRITDEYSYIIHNILKIFIEQSYLKLQLSEKQYKMKTAQLIALQSQINPHFLYNTLHAIYWEAFSYTRKPNKLTSMVSNLSDILKYSLDNPYQKVKLKDEISNTQAYIKIQQSRYIDKFKVIWSYDESLEDLSIIKLVMQPLIENCIYHGFTNGDKKYYIKIKILKLNSCLKISVIDNGSGITKEKLRDIRNNLEVDNDHSDRIGLFNTNKRLKLTYGEKYGLKIRSKLGHGTVVYIRIPITSN
jgi:two-component system sensor histidine kinase YesM